MDPTTSSSLPTDTDDEFPLIPEELWYERLLRYGLYFGGVFQLVCILAVIFLPPGTSSTSKAEVESDSSEDEEDTADCATVGGGISGQSNPGHKSRRKPERKKKR